MKKVLITGANSYVGTSVEKWLMREPENYHVETLDMKDPDWINYDFSKFDVVFHVAGIVHKIEVSKSNELYYSVNRDLPLEVAKKAKQNKVSQFIFISTMAVYGQNGKIKKEVIIKKQTPPNPKSIYAKSKLEAETEINKLSNDQFNIVILRPPMIYGPQAPGNYAKLEKFAKTFPIFPLIDNKRSMIHIDKLSEFIKTYIDQNANGLFLPQDDNYINTSQMVKEIALNNNKDIHLSRFAGLILKLFFKRFKSINKIFGSLIYENE